jgi:hypothetical protein
VHIGQPWPVGALAREGDSLAPSKNGPGLCTNVASSAPTGASICVYSSCAVILAEKMRVHAYAPARPIPCPIPLGSQMVTVTAGVFESLASDIL